MKATAEKPAIVLVAIGDVPGDLLDSLVEPLSAIFGLPCHVAAPIPIPPSAYDLQRRQYMGRDILTAMSRLDTPDPEHVLGVIDADCYAPGLNFVFGQASIQGQDAFIALPRLRQSFYGLPDDEPSFRGRALKEAVHELGHTYGLGHCPDPRCVMHFSNKLRDTDAKKADFCPSCRVQHRPLHDNGDER